MLKQANPYPLNRTIGVLIANVERRTFLPTTTIYSLMLANWTKHTPERFPLKVRSDAFMFFAGRLLQDEAAHEPRRSDVLIPEFNVADAAVDTLANVLAPVFTR
jgi:hypothetical protein